MSEPAFKGVGDEPGSATRGSAESLPSSATAGRTESTGDAWWPTPDRGSRVAVKGAGPVASRARLSVENAAPTRPAALQEMWGRSSSCFCSRSGSRSARGHIVDAAMSANGYANNLRDVDQSSLANPLLFTSSS